VYLLRVPVSLPSFLSICMEQGPGIGLPHLIPRPQQSTKSWAEPGNEATRASRVAAYAPPELTSCMDGFVSVQNCVIFDRMDDLDACVHGQHSDSYLNR